MNDDSGSMRAIIALPDVCPSCGSPIEVTFIQRCVGPSTSFSMSYVCRTCSRALEGDGDELPDDVRAAFVRRLGAWRLVIEKPGPNLRGIVTSIREWTSVSLRDGMEIAKTATPFADGTRVEVECRARVLRVAGAVVRVEPAD